MSRFQGQLSPLLVRKSVEAALEEDLGLSGDLTTNAIISLEAKGEGTIATRADGVIAGLDLAEAAFRALDADTVFERLVCDGDYVAAGDKIARIQTSGRALLSGERVALNFMTHMSGIASLTRQFVDKVKDTNASIVCTRKTLPGLRAVEKFAVAAGGGANHRFGLYDAVLIKDNHVAIAGGIGPAIELVAAQAGHMVMIEVEVDTIEQLKEALNYSVDVVMLDNMEPARLREAVAIAGGQVTLEASGGVNLGTVQAIAESGVDLISVGALTHSAPSLDLGLDIAISG